MPETIADTNADAAPDSGATHAIGAPAAGSGRGELSAEERRAALRRFDVQSQWTMLIASAIVVFLAIVLSVPGSAREEQVIIPGLNRALPPLCTSKILFDRECPGCGMTRCFISMAHGEVARAWRFNPVGVYFFVLVVAQLPYRSWQLWRLYRGKEAFRDSRLFFFLYLLMGLMLVQFFVFTFFGR